MLLNTGKFKFQKVDIKIVKICGLQKSWFRLKFENRIHASIELLSHQKKALWPHQWRTFFFFFERQLSTLYLLESKQMIPQVPFIKSSQALVDSGEEHLYIQRKEIPFVHIKEKLTLGSLQLLRRIYVKPYLIKINKTISLTCSSVCWARSVVAIITPAAKEPSSRLRPSLSLHWRKRMRVNIV